MTTVSKLIGEIEARGVDEYVTGVRRVDSETAKAGKSVDKSTSSMGASMQRVGKKMALVGGGLTAAVTLPVLAMGKAFGEELSAIEQANNATTKALARMGSGSLVTVASVQKLAGALQKASGMDDQMIQSGQNMILTLGNLDTATTAGARNFDLASRAMVNMAESMGTDATAAGRQLAVALAKPDQAAGRLTRAGVILTEQQKKQIKAFTDAGNKAAAQGVIIEAVGKKFKGAANLTSAEKWDVLKDRFLGIGASLLERLLPAFDKLVAIGDRVMSKFEALSPRMQTFVAVGVAIAAVLPPIILGLGMLAMAFGAIAPVAAAAWVAITGPVGLVVAAIAAVAVAGVALYKNWDTVKKKLGDAWDAIREKAVEVWDAIKSFVSEHAVLIALAVTGPIGALVVWMVRNWDTIHANVVTAWTAIRTTASTWAQSVANFIGNAVSATVGKVAETWTEIRTSVADAWGGIRSTAVTWAESVANFIGNAVDGAIGKVAGVWSSIRGGIADAWKGIRDTASTWAESVANFIVSAISGLPAKLAGIGKDAGSALAGAIKSAVNGVIDAWNGLSTPSFDIGIPGTDKSVSVGAVSLPDIPRLAKGGLAFGPTLAMVGDNPGARIDPEVVSPLSKLQRMIDVAVRGGAGAGGTGGGVEQHFHVERPVEDMTAFMRRARTEARWAVGR